MSSTSVLGRAVSVLEAAASAEGRTLREVVSMTGLPRSTAHRVAKELMDLRLLAYDPNDRRFKIGPRTIRLAYRGISTEDINAQLRPELSRLANAAGETAFFSRFCDRDVAIVLSEPPKESSRAQIIPALGVTPPHACSASRAILAFQTDEVVESLLSGPLPALTDKTLTDRTALAKELQAVRACGFALCDEEIEPGVSSIAVPVHLHHQSVLYSVGLVGPAERVRRASQDQLVSELKEAAQRLAFSLETMLSA